MTVVQKLFSFKGRMRRRDFWMCTLAIWFATIVGWVILLIANRDAFGAIIAAGGQSTPEAMGAIRRMGLGSYLIFGLTLWPNLAVNAKRLHDRGRSAGVAVLFYLPMLFAFVPSVGQLLSMTASLAVFGYWLVDLGILDGLPRGNMYGPSPKQASAGATVDEVFA